MAGYNYINETGTIIPDTSDLLTIVENEYKSVFGEDLDVSPSTPQGKFITAEVINRESLLRNNALLANQINPNLSGGVYLDAIGALTLSERDKNKFSKATVNSTGAAGTIIPKNVRMRTAAYDYFSSSESVTLDSEGLGQVIFIADKEGAIPAASGALSIIVDEVLGWETGTNPDAAILGIAPQSDPAFRKERRVTLAGQSSNLAEATITALYKLDGVTSVTFLENVSASTQVIDGVTMVAKSIYACVSGGDNTEIANAILYKKSGGCNYNNGAGTPITVTVQNPYSLQNFSVKFDRPEEIPVKIRVTIGPSPLVSNPADLVKKAILAYAAGEIPDKDGFIIGAEVSCFELSGAITCTYPLVEVKTVEIALSPSGDFGFATIPVEIFQQATTNEGSIIVVSA